jgi:hypothetical protein
MSEQQIDFKKIIYALKSEKYTPQQIGSFMKQYYVKHLKENDTVSPVSDSSTQTLDDVSKIFDGGLL